MTTIPAAGSWQLAERAGFQLEGILRRDAFNPQGVLRDTRYYARPALANT